MNDFKHEAASTEEQYGSPTYAWYVVIILLFAYVTSFLDRTILTLLVEPIRESRLECRRPTGLSNALAVSARQGRHPKWRVARPLLHRR